MAPKGRKKARNGFSLPASGAIGREICFHFGCLGTLSSGGLRMCARGEGQP